MTATTMDYLETYLQDHRAGAAMGADLAQRLAEENVGTPYEDVLLGISREIEQDLDTLDEIMERFGISPSGMKVAGAKIAEKVGRLKPNNQLTGYSPLSRVLELEGLRGGVHAKLGLWDSLGELATHDDRLDPEEMSALQTRAEEQLDTLRGTHCQAARDAFVEGADDDEA
jgi:hypothetical protein